MSDSVRPHLWGSPGKNTGVGCHFLLHCIKVKSETEVIQLRLTLCDPMDWSLPGSSVHGIFQARVLEWGAIAKLHPKKQTRSWVQGICHCSHWLQRPSSRAETPFHVPQFLIIGNKLYSWPFLSSNQQGQTPAKGKERMWRQGRTVRRNSSAALGQGLGSPQGIHITTSLSCLKILKPLPGGRS